MRDQLILISKIKLKNCQIPKLKQINAPIKYHSPDMPQLLSQHGIVTILVKYISRARKINLCEIMTTNVCILRLHQDENKPLVE